MVPEDERVDVAVGGLHHLHGGRAVADEVAKAEDAIHLGAGDIGEDGVPCAQI